MDSNQEGDHQLQELQALIKTSGAEAVFVVVTQPPKTGPAIT